MKHILKNLSKVFSLLLVIAVSFVTLTACSNKNKQATVTPAVESISDTTETSNEDLEADKVADEEENQLGPSTETTTEEDNDSSTSNYPVTPGIYNFAKESLNFGDIYYHSENELFDFFKTRDINGVYDIVYSLGFEDFSKNLTFHYIDDKAYTIVLSFSKNETADTELSVSNLYINTNNSFIDCGTNYVYEVKDGKIVNVSGSPEYIIDESGKVTILFPFTYVDETSGNTVVTPLYIKADLVLYKAIDIMDDSNLTDYEYVDGSAKFESLNGFLDGSASKSKLAQMLKIEENEILNTLQTFEFYFNEKDELTIVNTEQNFILTEKSADSLTYLLYDSCYISVVNEYHDATLDANFLNVQIQIDESTIFTFVLIEE